MKLSYITYNMKKNNDNNNNSADPYVKKAISSVENAILVECFVGPKSG